MSWNFTAAFAGALLLVARISDRRARRRRRASADPREDVALMVDRTHTEGYSTLGYHPSVHTNGRYPLP